MIVNGKMMGEFRFFGYAIVAEKRVFPAEGSKGTNGYREASAMVLIQVVGRPSRKLYLKGDDHEQQLAMFPDVGAQCDVIAEMGQYEKEGKVFEQLGRPVVMPPGAFRGVNVSSGGSDPSTVPLRRAA